MDTQNNYAKQASGGLEMKKVIIIMAAFFLFVMTANSEAINSLGLGLGLPRFKMNVESNEFGVDEVYSGGGLSLDLFYQRVSVESGLTFKADGALGTRWIDGENITDDIRAGYIVFTLGLGYSFVRNENTIVSLCGLIGWDVLSAEKSFYIYNNKCKYEETATAFSIGAALTGIKKLNRNLGLYGSLDMRFIIAGEDEYKLSRNGSNILRGTVDGESGYAINPAFGLCLMF